jgi:hypothetical protein
MIIECIENDGFEDVIEVGMMYSAELKGASFLIVNDRGRKCWYGRGKFKIVSGTMV